MSSGQQHPTPNHETPHEEKRDVSGRINVNGTVEVNFPESVVNDERTAREKSDDREQRKFRYDFVTLYLSYW